MIAHVKRTRQQKSSPKERPDDAAARQRLVELRQSLLKLHKTLIESDRIGYERTFGSVSSAGNFLQLLLQDPWFAWLRPLSQLIVLMDETLDGDEPITREVADTFAKNTRTLLTPADAHEPFAQHYLEALQRDPDVVLAHSETVKLYRG